LSNAAPLALDEMSCARKVGGGPAVGQTGSTQAPIPKSPETTISREKTNPSAPLILLRVVRENSHWRPPKVPRRPPGKGQRMFEERPTVCPIGSSESILKSSLPIQCRDAPGITGIDPDRNSFNVTRDFKEVSRVCQFSSAPSPSAGGAWGSRPLQKQPTGVSVLRSPFFALLPPSTSVTLMRENGNSKTRRPPPLWQGLLLVKKLKQLSYSSFPRAANIRGTKVTRVHGDGQRVPIVVLGLDPSREPRTRSSPP